MRNVCMRRCFGRVEAVLESGAGQPVLVLFGAVELLRRLELLPLAALGRRLGALEQGTPLVLGHRLEVDGEVERLLEDPLAVAAGDGDVYAGDAHRVAQALLGRGRAALQDE